MIALDTNLLIYAHRAGAPEHEGARAAIERLVDEGGAWGIPARTSQAAGPCITSTSICASG